MSSNTPATSHMQSLIQNIMSKFQSQPSTPAAPVTTQTSQATPATLPVFSRPIPPTPANYFTAPSIPAKPKYPATFLHFYSAPNSTPTSTYERPSSTSIDLPSNMPPVPEPVKEREAPSSSFVPRESEPLHRPSFSLNVPTLLPSNPFKRPQVVAVEVPEAPLSLPVQAEETR